MLDDLYQDEREFTWFKDSFSPEKIDTIFIEKQKIMKKRYNEFIESLTENDHLRAINLEVVPSHFSSFPKAHDTVGNSIYEILGDQLASIPSYITPLVNKYSFYMICNVGKNVSFTDLFTVFENNVNFEGLNFNHAKKHSDFSRDFIISWREANASSAITGLLSEAGHIYSITALSSKSQKIYVKTFLNREESAFHFFNVSKVGADVCANFGIDYSEFLNKLEELEKSVQFNLTLLFLFKVFNFNYFSGQMYWNEQTMMQKEGIVLTHVNFELPLEFDPTKERSIESFQDNENFQVWQKQIVQTNENLAHPNTKSKVEEKIQNKLKKEFNNCHEGIWVCDICEKLFETQDFLIKHAKQKHPGKCDKIRDKLEEEVERSNLLAFDLNRIYVNFDSVHLKYSLEKRKIESFAETNSKGRPSIGSTQIHRSFIADYMNL